MDAMDEEVRKSIFEKIKGKEAYSCFGLAASLIPLAYVVWTDHYAYTVVILAICFLGLAGLCGRLWDKRNTKQSESITQHDGYVSMPDEPLSGEIVIEDEKPVIS